MKNLNSRCHRHLAARLSSPPRTAATALLALGLLGPADLVPSSSAAAATLAASAPASAHASATATLAQRDKKKVPKGVHRNTRFGFEFKKPKKWENIAIKTDEEWLAAKYVSEKEYTYTHPDLGYTFNHAPELQVIVFPLEVMEDSGTKVDESEEDGEKRVTITIKNPYKDYDDFLDRTFVGGGFSLAEKEEDEIDGVRVTKLSYAVEKLAQSGPKTIETWIYHSEDVDYAVQVVGLTKHWKKIQRSFKSARQSFELIERDGPIKHRGSAGMALSFSRLDLSEGSAKERRSKGADSEKILHERAISKLPDEGWEHSKDGRVLLLTSADKRYSDRVQKHTNNVLEWMDDHFGYLADGKAYLRAPIVRVCKDIDEAAAFTAGVSSGGYGGSWSISEELVTWWDTSGWTGRAIDQLNDQICRYWMLEKNFALSTAMPDWIDNGLRELITTSRMDTRKPEWRRDEWNISQFKEAIREGRAGNPREMFLMTSREYNSVDSREEGADRWAQGALLINYLASPDIRRSRQAKGLLEDYLKNMQEVVTEVEGKSKSALDAARKKLEGDDGEKEYTAARRLIFTRKEKEILQKTFDKTFGGWDDNDWEAFTKGFYGAF